MPKKFGPNTNVSETVFVQVGIFSVNLQTWETRVINNVYEALIILTVNVYYSLVIARKVLTFLENNVVCRRIH